MSATKEIDCRIRVKAPVEKVWQAWTTREGAVSFFAPSANIEARPGGAYEILFNPSAASGQRGSEGMRIMALEPLELLSFSWNAPPHLPNVRKQMTFVEVRLSREPEDETEVRLRHSGWGSSDEWKKAFDYFSSAWPNVVLPRLKYSFEKGPVAWNDPPRF